MAENVAQHTGPPNSISRANNSSSPHDARESKKTKDITGVLEKFRYQPRSWRHKVSVEAKKVLEKADA